MDKVNARSTVRAILAEGDVVQVLSDKHDFLGCFGIVEVLRIGEVGLRMPRPMRNRSPMLYVHASEVALIGPAASRGPFGKQSAETHTRRRRAQGSTPGRGDAG